MKESKSKINEAQIYIGDKKDIAGVKSELEPEDKLFVVGDDSLTEEGSMEKKPMIVQYIGDKANETPFQIGEVKWQYVIAKYPDGKKDIGVYRFGHDLVYGFDWFKENILEPTQKIGESKNPKMSKGKLLEHIRKIKNK